MEKNTPRTPTVTDAILIVPHTPYYISVTFPESLDLKPRSFSVWLVWMERSEKDKLPFTSLPFIDWQIWAGAVIGRNCHNNQHVIRNPSSTASLICSCTTTWGFLQSPLLAPNFHCCSQLCAEYWTRAILHLCSINCQQCCKDAHHSTTWF